MKFYILLISIGCCVIASTKAYTPEEKLELEKKVFTVCKDKEKATDDDVKVLVDRLVPTTTTGKCLLACVHETIGLIKDGKPSTEGAMSVAKLAYPGNDKAVDMASTMMKDCDAISEADRCELATQLLKCVHASAVKQGVDPKKLL